MESVKPESVGLSSKRLRRIDVAMERLVDQGKIAGAVTLVARQGKVAHWAATGLMDREAGRPMQPDAIFRIASMTKPITVTAVMMLFEEGHFLLDDPIASFIPEFAQTKVFVRETDHGIEVADLKRPITIRHLLTHTSGLTYDFYPDDPVSRIYVRDMIWRPDMVLAEWITGLAALPLAHQPGVGWTYSVSIDVLGRLVEVISGLPLGTFFKQRIFEPLGLADTGFYVRSSELGRVAAMYSPSDQGGLQRDQTVRDLSIPPALHEGGGGLVSTASDYARFSQMLLDGGVLGDTRLLGRKAVELMTANQFAGAGNPFPPDFTSLRGYGFGLGMRTLVDVAQAGLPSSIGEFGWSGAYSTYFWIDPHEQLLGVFLTQLAPLNSRFGSTFQVLAYQALE